MEYISKNQQEYWNKSFKRILNSEREQGQRIKKTVSDIDDRDVYHLVQSCLFLLDHLEDCVVGKEGLHKVSRLRTFFKTLTDPFYKKQIDKCLELE